MSGSANVTQVVERAINNGKRQMGLVIDEDIRFVAASGEEYIIYGTEIFEFGGEATLYFCANKKNSSQKLIAKIYDNIPAAKFNDEYLNYRKTVSEYIIKNSDYKNKHLLPILDYGLMEYEMGGGVNPEYFVEIVPYCEKGDMDGKKISYNELKDKIIPQINEALKCLHNNGYVHRDVKPNNIFLYNDSYVLGDFGALTPAGKDGAHVTLTIQISYGYAPLEALSGVVVAPTDYYAFGMTIATLYAGKYIFKGIDDDKSASTVLEVQKALKDKKLPIKIENSTEKGIESLIIGLLNNDYNTRLDYNDVLFWCKNGSIPKEKQTNEFVDTFKGQHGECSNFEELSKYLNENWDEAIRHIVEKNTFENFVAKNNQGLALTVGDIISRFKKKKVTADAVVSQAIYSIYPDALRYKGYEFKKFSSIIEYLSLNTEESVEYFKEMLHNHLISWWIKERLKTNQNNNLSEPYKAMLPVIENIENVADKYDTLAYGMFINSIESNSYDNQSDLVSKIYHGNNRDEVFVYFKEFLDYFRNNSNDYRCIELMLAYLDQYISVINISFGTEEFKFDNILSFRESFEQIGDYQKIYTILMCLFEKVCSEKVKVREFYVNNGPFACYIWVKDNLNVYNEPNGTVLSSIRDLNIDYNKSIAELYSQLSLLEGYVYNIRRGIQMQLMHFKNTSDFVTLASEKGKFVQNSFNKHIALGFWELLEE